MLVSSRKASRADETSVAEATAAAAASLSKVGEDHQQGLRISPRHGIEIEAILEYSG